MLPQWLQNQCDQALMREPKCLPHLMYGRAWLTASPMEIQVRTQVMATTEHSSSLSIRGIPWILGLLEPTWRLTVFNLGLRSAFRLAVDGVSGLPVQGS